jgi:hypothetical protein
MAPSTSTTPPADTPTAAPTPAASSDAPTVPPELDGPSSHDTCGQFPADEVAAKTAGK